MQGRTNSGSVNNQDITILENGTYEASSGYTGFGTVNVDVEPKLSSPTFTSNGTYVAGEETVRHYGLSWWGSSKEYYTGDKPIIGDYIWFETDDPNSIVSGDTAYNGKLVDNEVVPDFNEPLGEVSWQQLAAFSVFDFITGVQYDITGSAEEFDGELYIKQNLLNVEYSNLQSVDIIAAVKHKNMVCVQVFFVRAGQNCGNVPYFLPKAYDMSEAEIIEAFISSFYAEHNPPKEIIVSCLPDNNEFLENAVGCHINFYQKGNKAKLAQRAKDNAVEAINRKLAATATVESNLLEMQKYFGLPRIPQRIEIYDNSHNQGSYAIGAMVVATPEGFDKKSYRTFNIKYTENTHDDFAMMKEVLVRRFEHMADENRPDVILLDGGLGQLHAVHEALKNYDLSGITVIAISKGPERNAGKEFYHIIGKESFSLPFQSPIAFYMQNLRDEAHRFAIGTHRKKRAKSIYKSQIDEIEGMAVDCFEKNNLQQYCTQKIKKNKAITFPS